MTITRDFEVFETSIWHAMSAHNLWLIVRVKYYAHVSTCKLEIIEEFYDENN